MKKILALLLAFAMVFALCACGASETPAETPAETPVETPAEAPAADAPKGSVYWLNFKPESDEALQAIAKTYTEKTGVEVKVVTAASGTYEETLTAQMDKSGAPTLFVAGTQAAVDSWGDYCLDLKGTAIANELNTDEYMLYDADGKLCSIGYCYECYGIITNKALLEKAGYAITDITNFESLKKVAEDITARKDELGFSAFTSACMCNDCSWRFTGHVANLEYYYESVDNPAAWESCPAELTGAYMDNYRNLMDLMFNNSTADRKELAGGGFDANAEFANGEAVFYVNGNWEWAGLSEKGMKAEDLAMIPYYCGVEGEEKAALNCGTENYWAVNSEASEDDIQATLDFMYWLVTDPAASEAAVATFGVMPYKQAAASANPFFVDANNYLGNGNYNMWWATNYQPNVGDYRTALVSAINDYNADPSDANWEKVETAFVGGWAVQYKAANG